MNPLRYYLRKIYLLFKIKKILRGKNTVIECGATVDPGRLGSIAIGSNCYIHSKSILKCYGNGKIIIGDNVGVNPFSILYGAGDLRIGNNVRIAPHAVIVPSNHNFSNPDINICEQGITKIGITIADDVWIGANVTILDGVSIGKHSVIGAGSVVTTNIPPYSLAAGIPCKVIRKIGNK